MFIDNTFKNAIEKAFYDKTVTKCTVATTTEADGNPVRAITPTQNTFKANVRFDKLAIVKQEYGIETDIDIAISTHEVLTVGGVVRYGGIDYELVQVNPRDSHYFVIGRKWRS